MNSEAAIKRTIKDSVFTTLFNELKYLKELCKVLNPNVADQLIKVKP